MKKIYYQDFEQINSKYYLHVNFMNDTFMFMDEKAHNAYINIKDVSEIKETDMNLYQNLLKYGFIVDDDIDEESIVSMARQQEIYDTSMYNVIINPTLDCNLNCWYCYENKIKNSKISQSVINGIKKNIAYHYSVQPYRQLKLSFFGGEPFLCFDVIKELTEYASSFCKAKGVDLLMDFTTNGTLLSKEIIQFLAEYRCLFQITLDGCREQHNKIKYSSDRTIDEYEKAVDNIKLIQNIIKQVHVFVRINFDKRTLSGFDSILKDIESLDRDKTIIILKKIWQVNQQDVDKDEIITAIEKLFALNFTIDYYSQLGLCFAERLNEVVINYDGLAFKCTTITKFNKENSFGHLNNETGQIMWNTNKLSHIVKDITTDKCKKCRMYPVCYGQCNNHLLAGINGCFLDTLNLSRKEYFMFLYKKSRQLHTRTTQN
jgi:uncharacterized protein